MRSFSNINININQGVLARAGCCGQGQNRQLRMLGAMLKIMMRLLQQMGGSGNTQTLGGAGCKPNFGGCGSGHSPSSFGGNGFGCRPQSKSACGTGQQNFFLGLNFNMSFNSSKSSPKLGACVQKPKTECRPSFRPTPPPTKNCAPNSPEPKLPETKPEPKPVYETYTEKQEVKRNEKGKMWDVWFDHKDGQKTKRLSPLVLDLNKNGKADITGDNVTGDGKVTGPTTKFDIDPEKASYKTKSKRRRPGKGAPSAKGGHWQDGKYLDKDNKVVGEMKGKDYHYGNRETREDTEWLKKNGGDGLLVWDVNKDGNIGSSKELFGNFDIDGKKKFDNGFEKLGHYFDKNKDGKVNGDELKGLQVWKDTNADGTVDKGELQSLKEHKINEFDVSNYDKSSMEGSLNRQTVETTEVEKTRLVGFQ